MLGALIAGSALLWFAVNRQGRNSPDRTGLSAQAPAIDLTSFERAAAPVPFEFPTDHGAHPDFQTEWWYYTGNLTSADGRRFGYQLTFFRRALLPASQTPVRESQWASGQVYMAHFAVSDINDERFQAFERLSRGAAGLAGAQPGPELSDRTQPFRVWLEGWQVMQAPPASEECPHADIQPCAYILSAAEGNVSLALNLIDARGPALQGDRGYSRKGHDAGQASYYYSLTRLETSGTVTVNGEPFEVTGWSWMDHEWSTSALAAEQIGWDWFSIQLENGVDLMVFQIRRADGSVDPFSSGLLIYPDGQTQPLDREAFSIEVTDQWQSPHSQAVYPAGWIVRIPQANLSLEITPHMADQELNLSYAYWEGAVGVQAQIDGVSVVGNGYVELTGYSDSLGGEF
jgi:predicted secreted hydrolase